ncbi:MAG: hypothetical protein ACU84Q_14870 [Gammaproteobacteria bacterium]
MYMVAFMYPSASTPQDCSEFDYEHFVSVHLPMGLGLTKKYLGITPEKIVVYNPITDGEGAYANRPYCAISSVFFRQKSDAKTFCSLFSHEEAARRLSEDFANYTPGAPEVIMAQVNELTNISEMIANFESSETSV